MLQMFEAIIPHARPTFVKNGVAALRQEAFHADRHFLMHQTKRLMLSYHKGYMNPDRILHVG